MRLFRVVLVFAVLALAGAGGLYWWANQPLKVPGSGVEFEVANGSSIRAIEAAIRNAGVRMPPYLFNILARWQGRAQRLKSGTYAIGTATTPLALLDRMERGDVVMTELVVVEGWTFHQMRDVIDRSAGFKHTLSAASDRQILASINAPETDPEGLFFPDTYRFSKGTADVEVYRRAYREEKQRLAAAWKTRSQNLPISSPYEALILASIIEKETGNAADRPQVGAVFVNRLRKGMLLQTDPTVIYGMGSNY